MRLNELIAVDPEAESVGTLLFFLGQDRQVKFYRGRIGLGGQPPQMDFARIETRRDRCGFPSRSVTRGTARHLKTIPPRPYGLNAWGRSYVQ